MSTLTDIQSEDLLNLFCGDKLGEGCYRTVFAHQFDAKQVIKKDNMRNFSNVNEFQMWQELEETPLAKWLAPCYGLSGYGVWLLQARTEPLQLAQLPAEVPAIFSDLKLSNWGMFEGRPVCHDYGNTMLYRLARKHGARLTKAEWRG